MRYRNSSYILRHRQLRIFISAYPLIKLWMCKSFKSPLMCRAVSNLNLWLCPKRPRATSLTRLRHVTHPVTGNVLSLTSEPLMLSRVRKITQGKQWHSSSCKKQKKSSLHINSLAHSSSFEAGRESLWLWAEIKFYQFPFLLSPPLRRGIKIYSRR